MTWCAGQSKSSRLQIVLATKLLDPWSFFLNFVSMPFLCQKLLYVAYVWITAVVLKLLSSFGQKLQRRGGGGKMVLIVVEAVPARGKPPAGVDVFDAFVDQRAVSLHIARAAGSMQFSSPKLV